MRVPAGELGFRHVGMRVAVTYAHGNITSTIQDVLEKVTHEKDGTRLFFVGTKWRPNTLSLLSSVTDIGLLVDSPHFIEIKDQS
jgi:hypothetical protein